MTARAPVVAVGVVCFRGPDEVLLIKRARPPLAGKWSIPGGKVELGEPHQATALRELYEETGVDAELIGLIDIVDSIETHAHGDVVSHYVLIDFVARWKSGDARAGDDAAAAQFTPFEEAVKRLSWDQTRRVLHKARSLFCADAR